MDSLKIGYSPCPNDTFIFHALATGLVERPAEMTVTLADVEELNTMAGKGELDVVKVSVAAAVDILDEYVLLRAGGAMGFGVGPIVVASEACELVDLDKKKVAIPGRKTTANLLFGLCCKESGIEVELEEKIFDQVMPSVAAGEVAAGVVIHEGRFTFKEHGMEKIMDLGAWWESYSGLPIPLGAIAMKRSLGAKAHRAMNEAIRQSLMTANNNPKAGHQYIRDHAQEMDEDVIRTHIETFVTDYSLDVGIQGVEAVSRLLAEAGCKRGDIFVEL